MKTIIRTSAVPLLLMASLCGCSSVSPEVSPVAGVVELPSYPKSTKAPVPQPSPSLDAYKTQVAYHVMQHNPDQIFSGRLPEMLPAIVVVNVTVDKDGGLRDVAVQRSRDSEASRVAIDSMRRSGPLPKPVNLIASGDAMTFSETFLFDDQYRFQLRSVAGPQ